MIPFRTAVGLWVKVFGKNEIIKIDKTVRSDDYYYKVFSRRARKNVSDVFYVIVPDKDQTTGRKILFDVGLHKSKNRWYVDENKLLNALNEKRNIVSDEEIQNYYNKIKKKIGFVGNIEPLLDIQD